MGSWQELEQKVIAISETIWSTNAKAEDINGVKCDCVLKVKPDYWVIVEISKENTLPKLRTDLAKFSSLKFYLLSQQIFAECYFITDESHKSLEETGKGNHVEVHSVNSFVTKFLGSSQYINERTVYPFGSAVDPESGKKDTTAYVEIKYEDETGKKWNLSDIASYLRRGSKIVIMGEFGTGKSRCLMEIFKLLADSNSHYVPIAINLRDNWGYKKFNHIIQNHLDELGLSDFKDNLIRSIQKGKHPILLDGFDEIGSQTWGGDSARLSEIRKGSLQGVRDLVNKCPENGLLITGREHYFNTNKELLECLGLKEDKTILLKCPDEFSRIELEEYIKARASLSNFPEWLPKKPLLCQLLTRIENTKLQELVCKEVGEIEFFESVLDAICEREARIHPTIFKDSLKNILLELATLSRSKQQNVGPISPSEINEVFEKVTGASPIDESAIVLQRLPYLGRSSSGSADRIFIDGYAVDGLRAMAMVKYFFHKSESIKYLKWNHPLMLFGQNIVGEKIHLNDESIKYFKILSNTGNSVATGDFVSGVLSRNDDVDFKSMSVDNAIFHSLDFESKQIKNLTIENSIIYTISVDMLEHDNLIIKNCTIDTVVGVSGSDGLPTCFINCEADNYDNVLTISRISELKIDDEHKTLLSLLKKLFFQPGKGRKEEALLRGTEKYWKAETAYKIINYLMKDGIVDKFKGKDGLVYFPIRSHTSRIRNIMQELNNSKDPIWNNV